MDIINYFYESRDLKILAERRIELDFESHLHEHIELGYIEEGTSELWIEDKQYMLKKGDFFFVFPNTVHSYVNTEDFLGYVLIFPPELLSEYERLFSKKIPENPVVTGDKAEVDIIKMICSIDSVSRETARGLILALVSMLMPKLSLQNLQKYNVNTLKSLLIYCNENYTEPITVQDTAEYLHISRSHIAHIFKDKLHTTFSELINSKRIDHAKELLKNGSVSVTETAFLSGFNSVRTFNRIFRQYTGQSPREYVKNN